MAEDQLPLQDLEDMADGLLYTVTKSLELLAPALDSVLVGALRDACEDLKEACAATDRDRIIARIEELMKLRNDLENRFRDL
jgi:hypothetical protein